MNALAEQIRQHILRDVEDARIRDLGASIIDKYNVPARSPKQLARAFQLFSQNEIKFFREYPEVIAAPWVTAKWKLGDCDDKSRLIAALLKSFRIPVQLKFVRFVKNGKAVSHVWPEFAEVDPQGNQGPWVALESVQPWPMGKSAEDALKAKGIKFTSFAVEI